MRELDELREKYLRMRALREERDRSLRAGVEPVAPRDELRELSRRWPGALAELDRIGPDVLHDRIAILEDVLCRGLEPPLWARAWILTHARLRGALAIKFALRGGRAIAPNDVFPEESRPYLARIAEIERPPRGRLVELVYADVALALDIDPGSLRDLLMPRAAP